MQKKKTYWKNSEQLNYESSIIKKLEQNEFVEKLPIGPNSSELIENSSSSRRDFLKFVGFSTAAAAAAACEGPVVKSIPYVLQPEQLVPGVSSYYATSIADGFDFANILVKTREGRPIKIENNNESKFFSAANARVHASVLSMYDSKRVKAPISNLDSKPKSLEWDDLYLNIKNKLDLLSKENKKVILLTNTIPSPTTKDIIKGFIAKYPNVEHVIYDTVSSHSASEAYRAYYGKLGLVDYDFSNTKLIVSISADFLGDWQGGGYNSGYSKNRVPDKDDKAGIMSKHIQFESNMTLTGSNADERIPCNLNDQKLFLTYIYNSLLKKNNQINIEGSKKEKLDQILSQIKSHGSRSVVITGIEDLDAQKMVLEINNFIQSNAFDTSRPRLIKESDIKILNTTLESIYSGEVKGILTFGVNPVYSLPGGQKFKSAVKKMDLSVAFSMLKDETASICQFIAATPHFLESWGDYEFKKDFYSLAQPTIRPLFNTNQFQDIILKLTENNKTYYNLIKEKWKKDILEKNKWNKVLHDGFYEKSLYNSKPNFKNIISSVNTDKFISSKINNFHLTLYTKTGLGDGQQANNPWLQEFPDPITRTTWDNYLTVSFSDAKELGLKNVNVSNGALNGSYANISNGSKSLKVPVIIQPGQAKGTVGLALGYGRVDGLKKEMQVGINAYEFYENFNSHQSVTVSLTEGFHEFACVQLQNTLMGRGDIIRETTLEIFNTKDKKHWNPVPVVSKNHIEEYVTSKGVDMYEEFDRSIGHHFNLSIDLNSCTGCGACVIACHAENNVPVVGKTEIRKSRDMHWLRIDRYYSSEDSFENDNLVKENAMGLTKTMSTLTRMENASENPQVAFQPIMCQHCNHAPCETVCPVGATAHGRQGQNHMAYNRCVGTRYCANNCPYKVRRFNWFLYNNNDEFDFYMNDDLGKMVINPDVVVRSRGVMEKCSFCIQMTQKTILDAKLEGREINDGEWKTACSSACNTGAIVFGDVNDKNSEVSKMTKNDRMYRLLESVGTKPNVMYQTKVRNI
jgi:molybdopterin-containing oxidoreductase family iron-sulfur binding subunit